MPRLRIFLVLFLSLSTHVFGSQKASAIKGEASLDSLAEADITGEWLILLNEFLSPTLARDWETIRGRAKVIKVPSFDYYRYSEFDYNFATIMLRMRAPMGPKAIFFENISSSFKVYFIDLKSDAEVLASEFGTLSQSPIQPQSSHNTIRANIPDSFTDFIIVVQASAPQIQVLGKPMSNPGIGGEVTFSSQKEARRYEVFYYIDYIFIIGCLFFLVVYSLFLCFVDRGDPTHIYIFATSFTYFLRGIVNYNSWSHLFPDVDFSFLANTSRVLTMLGAFFSIHYLIKSFPEVIPKKVEIAFNIAMLFNMIFVGLPYSNLQALALVDMVIHFGLTTLECWIVGFWILIKSTRDKPEGKYALIGYTLYAALFGRDALVNIGVIDGPFLSRYGMVAVVLSFAIMGAKRVARIHEETKIQKDEIADLNQNLERKVEEKTVEVRQQRDEIERSAASMKLILESINEGIIKVNSRGEIEAGSSTWAFRVFGFKVGDNIESIVQALDAPEDSKATTLTVLKGSLGEADFQWDVNAGNILTSARYCGRDLSISWQPIVRNFKVTDLIVTVVDETEKRQAERLSRESEEKAERLIRKARILLKGNIKSAQAFLGDIPRLINGLDGLWKNDGDTPTLLRNVHTIKGGARTIRMVDVRDTAHAIEDARKANDLAAVQSLVNRLKEELREYEVALHDVIGIGSSTSHEHVFDIVHSLRDDIKSRFASNYVAFRGVNVRDELDPVPAEVKEILLHAITNSADHGFILPFKRGLTVDDALIKVEAYGDGKTNVLKIKDNGIGIDWKKIDELCVSKGFTPAPGRPKTDVVFLEGVSTAEGISTTSGRGVGMGAVKAAAEALDGTATLLDNEDGQGTMLVITWSDLELPTLKAG